MVAMARVMVGLLAFALALVLAPLYAMAQDEVVKGHRLAQALCAQCHLNEDQGEKQGPMGIPGFGAVANRPGQTRDGIIAWLKSVPPMMPNHNLTQDEMYALSAYIMSLRNRP